MKLLLIATTFFTLLTSCLSKDYSSDYFILNDVLCELLGNEYEYETYASFYSDTVNQDLPYEVYLSTRKELKDSLKVIFLNSTFGLPQGYTQKDFLQLKEDSIFLLNSKYMKLYEGFIKNCETKAKFDINRLNVSCRYHFAIMSDKRLNNFKPSERAIFFISRIIYSDNNQNACFYITGGRGGYTDSFVILTKHSERWYIEKKIPVKTY